LACADRRFNLGLVAFPLQSFSAATPTGQMACFIEFLTLTEHAGWLSPILHTIPLQLLAYHVALQKSTHVDKPRNLAKSVTVE